LIEVRNMGRDGSRRARDTCKALMGIQGISYENWLTEKHVEYIVENGHVITETANKKEENNGGNKQ